MREDSGLQTFPKQESFGADRPVADHGGILNFDGFDGEMLDIESYFMLQLIFRNKKSINWVKATCRGVVIKLYRDQQNKMNENKMKSNLLNLSVRKSCNNERNCFPLSRMLMRWRLVLIEKLMCLTKPFKPINNKIKENWRPFSTEDWFQTGEIMYAESFQIYSSKPTYI